LITDQSTSQIGEKKVSDKKDFESRERELNLFLSRFNKFIQIDMLGNS